MFRILVISIGFFSLVSCGQLLGTTNTDDDMIENAIISNYADIAYAIYDDSLLRAEELSLIIDKFLESPSEEALTQARRSWIATREPYMQSEAFRFGNPIVDSFDARLNAWPLDESFIDYVAENPLAAFGIVDTEAVNIIALETIQYGGQTLDATVLDKDFLQNTLHELGGNEAFVATGFHAIEFLLWGQDLESTVKKAGNRPATDYDLNACTNPPCVRRIAYLKAAMELLLDDLRAARNAWAIDGAARLSLTQIPSEQALGRMFHGLGSLSYGELAGERMKLGLMLQDPEEEHDCFSDNTHNAHYYDALGIANVWQGRYVRLDKSEVSGSSLNDLVAQNNPELAGSIRNKLNHTMNAFSALRQRGETVEHYDQMITGQSDESVKTIEAAIEALINLANDFERAAVSLELAGEAFEGSNSLDAPETIGN